MSGIAKSGTTPFPNHLLDEAMLRLKDTEWRLLCVIVRQTLGHYDSATKGRKERDWITREQLKARTGRESEALAKAVDVLVKKKYIVAETQDGTPLSTPSARRGYRARIYYRLTHALGKESELKIPLPCSINRSPARQSELVSAAKANRTKETLTKENVTKRESSFRNRMRVSASQGTSDLQVMAKQVFDGQVLPEKPKSLRREALASDRDPSGLSIEGHMFITLFADTARQHAIAVNTSLTSEERTRLETLIKKRKGMNWRPALELFFQSDIGHVTRNRHSLHAFLGSYNLFLLRIPAAAFSAAPRSAAPRVRHGGWRNPAG